MRLGARAADAIGSVVARAMSGECVVRIHAPSRTVARRMFTGVTTHIEKGGGAPQPSRFSWVFSNGSEVRIVFDEA